MKNTQLSTNDIIALCRAGFSKSDIIAMTASAAVQPTPTATASAAVQPTPTATASAAVQPTPTATASAAVQPTPTAAVQPTPTAAVQPTAETQSNPIYMTDEQLRTLCQSINAGNAGIDIPPTYDISSVLGEHYKTLMVGEKGE